jgi:hypothetical protein
VSSKARLIKYAIVAAVCLGCLLIAGALMTVAVILGIGRTGQHLGIEVVAEMTRHAIMSFCLGAVLVVAGFVMRAKFTRKVEAPR